MDENVTAAECTVRYTENVGIYAAGYVVCALIMQVEAGHSVL
jgi:hypothetical protein